MVEAWELQDVADRIVLQAPSLQALIEQLNEAGTCVCVYVCCGPGNAGKGSGGSGGTWGPTGGCWAAAKGDLRAVVGATPSYAGTLLAPSPAPHLLSLPSRAGDLLKKGAGRYQVCGVAVQRVPQQSGPQQSGAAGRFAWGSGGAPAASQLSAGSKRGHQQSQQQPPPVPRW